MTGIAHTTRRMGGLAAAASLAVAAFLVLRPPTPATGAGVSPGPGRDVTSVTDVDAGDTALGQQLYVQSCASCHGFDGRGGPNGPSLENAGPAHHDFYLRTGRMPLAAPGQPQYRQEPAFNEEQIRALVAYASGFGQGPEIPQYVEGAPLPRGWELYVENCASCHSTAGAGGAIGGGFVAPGLGRSDPRIVQEAMLIGPGPMPVFPWSDEETSAVAGYVQYLRNPPSPGGFPLAGVGPVPEGFVAGVVGLGGLVLISRWVARRRHGAREDEVQLAQAAAGEGGALGPAATDQTRGTPEGDGDR